MFTRPRKSSCSVAASVGVGLGVMLASGCGRGPDEAPARDAHDAPVPASEARAELTLDVSLVPRHDCEEAFDLALYKEPAVELISWSGDTTSCEERRVKVRYLSAKTTREAIVSRVRELAKKALVVNP